MEYQKVVNLLDNAPNQPTKFSTKNWVKVNKGSYDVYSTGSQIKLKTSMLGQLFVIIVTRTYLLKEL